MERLQQTDSKVQPIFPLAFQNLMLHNGVTSWDDQEAYFQSFEQTRVPGVLAYTLHLFLSGYNLQRVDVNYQSIGSVLCTAMGELVACFLAGYGSASYGCWMDLFSTICDLGVVLLENFLQFVCLCYSYMFFSDQFTVVYAKFGTNRHFLAEQIQSAFGSKISVTELAIRCWL